MWRWLTQPSSYSSSSSSSSDDKQVVYLVQQQQDTPISILLRIIAAGATAVSMYFMYKHMIDAADPNRKDKLAGKKAKSELVRRIRERSDIRLFRNPLLEHKIAETNTYEELLMADLVFPDQISTSFDDIGGLDEIKLSLRKTVLSPFLDILKAPSGLHDQLLSAPKGVLFYGPPGTGKSMMAKAIAKSSNSAFLNLRMSSIESKWYGESLKFVRAVFSLAQKLAPTIIFIDEIDGFLRQRGLISESETSIAMKSEFMALWDGILSETESIGENSQILIIGATNRPQDIDEAIMRRLPRKFAFPLPDLSSRISILRALLKTQKLENISIDELGKLTDGYSGSDLKELCRFAVTVSFHENRALKGQDFERARAEVRASVKQQRHHLLD
jgi:SpoVK/Ycf46/Vps4 family AAA+-type ATPase